MKTEIPLSRFSLTRAFPEQAGLLTRPFPEQEAGLLMWGRLGQPN